MSFGEDLNNLIGCEKISDLCNYVTRRDVLAHFRAVSLQDLLGVSKAYIAKEAIALTSKDVSTVFSNIGHDKVTKSSVVQ